MADKPTSKTLEVAQIFLTPMQSSGIQFVAAYKKQLQASADALTRVKKAMDAVLFDPSSAQYSDIKIGRNGSVCGKYNAKNRYGAYVGFKDFVMTGDGRIVTTDTSDGTDGISGAYYYSTYVEACGTKAEIAAYRSVSGFPPIATTTETEPPAEQEPDQILDAPPARKRPVSQDVPTA